MDEQKDSKLTLIRVPSHDVESYIAAIMKSGLDEYNSSKKRRQKQKKSLLYRIFGLLIFVGLAILILCIFLSFQLRDKELCNDINLCVTFDCFKIGHSILEQMNLMFSPCKDIYMFSCGGRFASLRYVHSGSEASHDASIERRISDIRNGVKNEFFTSINEYINLCLKSNDSISPMIFLNKSIVNLNVTRLILKYTVFKYLFTIEVNSTASMRIMKSPTEYYDISKYITNSSIALNNFLPILHSTIQKYKIFSQGTYSIQRFQSVFDACLLKELNKSYELITVSDLNKNFYKQNTSSKPLFNWTEVLCEILGKGCQSMLISIPKALIPYFSNISTEMGKLSEVDLKTFFRGLIKMDFSKSLCTHSELKRRCCLTSSPLFLEKHSIIGLRFAVYYHNKYLQKWPNLLYETKTSIENAEFAVKQAIDKLNVNETMKWFLESKINYTKFIKAFDSEWSFKTQTLFTFSDKLHSVQITNSSSLESALDKLLEFNANILIFTIRENLTNYWFPTSLWKSQSVFDCNSQKVYIPMMALDYNPHFFSRVNNLDNFEFYLYDVFTFLIMPSKQSSDFSYLNTSSLRCFKELSAGEDYRKLWTYIWMMLIYQGTIGTPITEHYTPTDNTMVDRKQRTLPGLQQYSAAQVQLVRATQFYCGLLPFSRLEINYVMYYLTDFDKMFNCREMRNCKS